ncbi:MAG TPA: histidine ammonia-lyase [Chloroflexi bacterium]|jgi:histidine ammonia-lyase|nr:histidine ammonia-lyase [Chloroflexota bacterium]
MAEFYIDGRSLTIEQVVKIADDPSIQVKIAPDALADIERAAAAVHQFVLDGKIAYGITTGFGAFKDRLIPVDQVEQLQENIILSHAVGVGPHLDDRTVRAMILIRANTLAKGHSGIRVKTLELLLELLNKNLLPVIPSKGSLGASGDLAPLAHMSLPLLGFGQVKMNGEIVDSADAFQKVGLEPIRLAAKEGLALTNGTTMMTAIAALGIDAAEALINTADCAGALGLEAQNGTLRAFLPQIHQSRPQNFQQETAEHIRSLLQDSQFTRPDSSRNVQDAYTLRCIPQVHGAVRNALSYARSVVEIELNSVTDNPLLFFDQNDQVEIISGGNFHGEPLALAMDFLAIALADLGNMAERRIAKLIDNNTEHYPSFLAAEGGLNSGFMLLQYTAAALASENKTLAHPSSLDSIPSSGNVEDHVSMGANAALHCAQVLDNVNAIIAIELMSAAQAIDFRLQKSPELQLGSGTKIAMRKIREAVPFFEHDEFLQPSMQKLIELVKKKTFAFC